MAIEYRHYAPSLFDTLLVVGSLLTALTQGIIFGTLLQGIPTDGQHYTGNGVEWLRPFPLYCGMALASGYCVMGAGWLIWRCTGELEVWGRHMIRWLVVLAGVLLGGLLGMEHAAADRGEASIGDTCGSGCRWRSLHCRRQRCWHSACYGAGLLFRWQVCW